MNIHSKQLGKECMKRAKDKWGRAWPMLSEEQRQGAVALEVVSVVVAQVPNESDFTLTHLRGVAVSAMGWNGGES